MRIAVILIIAAIVVYSLLPDRFSKDLYFSGETYSHVMKKSGGEIVNHFYTLHGEEMTSARDFIQLLEFEGEIDSNNWQSVLGPLLNRYHLQPVEEGSNDRVGEFSMQGMDFYSVGTPLMIEDKTHYIVYVSLAGTGEDSISTPRGLALNELKGLSVQFQ